MLLPIPTSSLNHLGAKQIFPVPLARKGPKVCWRGSCSRIGDRGMALPRSEIVARPMLPRACGCMCEFQHYAVDRYRAERLAKFQSTRCPECVAKDEEQQRQAKAELPTKGD